MTERRTVVVERDLAHPPEKLWRALTQPHQMAEWLMQNDFAPTVGHRFNLPGEWGGAPVWEHGGIICTGETWKAVALQDLVRAAAALNLARTKRSKV